MLLEAFVNRYRNPGVAPIHFATIVLPLTMILGALICFVGTPTVIIMAVCDIYPEVFSPKLSMVCALAGGGLFLAPLAIGAMHGQIREKQRGIVREGYGPKMMAYLFMLGIALPFPALYGAKFFYNYPFAHYPSYILEVKPSPELKAEIERFGLAEIKWHTPYDYSLDRQVIRYDFGEPVDGDWTSYYSKFEILREVVTQVNREYINAVALVSPEGLVLIDATYPFVLNESSPDRVCVVEVGGFDVGKEKNVRYKLGDEVQSIPLIASRTSSGEQVIYLDLSSVFGAYKKETAYGYVDSDYSCSLYSSFGDAYFVVVPQLMFPVLYQSIYSFKRDRNLSLDLGFDNFVLSVRSL